MDNHLLDALADTLSRLEVSLATLLPPAERGQVAAASTVAAIASRRDQLARYLAAHGVPDPRPRSTVNANTQRISGIRDANPAFQRAADFSQLGSEGAFQLTLWVLRQQPALAALGLPAAATEHLWRSLVCYRFRCAPFPVLEQELAPHLPTGCDAGTVLDTAMSLLDQLSLEAVFDSDLGEVRSLASELYQYVGPIDGLTRAFCREHIGRVYTKAQIAALDPTRDVFLLRGGDTCRHKWRPGSRLSDELYRLHASGERDPWMAEQLARCPSRT